MTTSCGGCGVALSEADTVFDEQGNVRCQACLMHRQATDAGKVFHAKIVNLAYSAPVIGLISLVFNPIAFFSLAAIGNGLYVLRSLRQPDAEAFTGERLEKVKVGAIAGIALGGCSLTFYFLLRFVR